MKGKRIKAWGRAHRAEGMGQRVSEFGLRRAQSSRSCTRRRPIGRDFGAAKDAVWGNFSISDFRRRIDDYK